MHSIAHMNNWLQNASTYSLSDGYRVFFSLSTYYHLCTSFINPYWYPSIHQPNLLTSQQASTSTYISFLHPYIHIRTTTDHTITTFDQGGTEIGAIKKGRSFFSSWLANFPTGSKQKSSLGIIYVAMFCNVIISVCNQQQQTQTGRPSLFLPPKNAVLLSPPSPSPLQPSSPVPGEKPRSVLCVW